MKTKPDLTPEEARNWRLAKLFDLRSFIGALFVIFGVLLIIPGLSASKAMVHVGPPLSWSGPSIGTALIWSPGAVRNPPPSSLLTL